MKHFLLLYTFAPHYLEQRLLFRDAHLRCAWEAQHRGNLVLAGALSDPADMGILLFEATSPDLVDEFARNDPYVVNGLVTSWRVREWITVVGASAQAPVYPGSFVAQRSSP
jgi:uncharacterized protein YciI